MSSRQEEKQRRREARLAQEQAAAQAAARKRLVGRVGGVLLGLAAAAIVVVALVSGGGGGGGGGGAKPKAPGTPGSAKLPAQKIADLDKAAKAAGCVLQNPKNEGRGHTSRPGERVSYKSNPPTSGRHDPAPADEGVYESGSPARTERLVHALEHGRIVYQYRPGLPATKVKQLEALAAEKSGYHVILTENTTRMPYEVAATAWGHLVGCRSLTSATYDAFRTFRDRYVDKGPEGFIP